jgi:hypothetical protein
MLGGNRRGELLRSPQPCQALLLDTTFLFPLKTCQVDEYGTQQPIALLKLLLEKGYLYDRGKELNCKSIRDLGFIAAMGKAGGGRNEVDPRFLSLFSVFNVPFPSEESLNLIYYSILKGHTSVTRTTCGWVGCDGLIYLL